MVVYEPTGKPILYVWLDYETQSAESISCGAARYAQHPSTRAYMASLHICEPRLNDTTQHRFVWTDTAWSLDMPEGWQHVSGIEWLQELFATPTHEVWAIAHNVSFERSISEYTLGLPLPARWIDTMDLANSKGLPAALGKLGELRYGTPKDEAGRNLMMKLCAPPKKGRNKGEMPDITQDDIQRLLKYSITDTVVCRRFSLDTAILMTPPEEQDIRDCHHAINHFGIGFDLDYATKLDSMEQFFVAQARANVEEVTGGAITGDDLSRVKFLLAEINANLPAHLQMDNLRARTVEDLLEDAEEDEEIPHEVVEVLKARMIVTRAALDKVRAAMASVCADGRIRDQFVYWGAHTGRWSGRGTQPQNMKKPDEDFDLQGAIDAVRLGDSAAFLKLCVDAKGRTRKPFELLGSLVRGIFIPRPGHVFVVGDYASIEARMLMWLAKQEKGLQEHRDADAGLIDDTYCSFASSIYGFEVKKKTHKKERSAGKIGQLACGFGGGENAVNRMSFGMHIDLEAAGTDGKTVVNKWRSHYNKVPPYWSEVELAFRRAADNRETSDAGRCRFWARSRRDRDRVVEIELPSGRILTYMGAAYNFSEKEGRKDKRVISYQTSNRGAVRTKEIWGGTICENITQAASRDCLARTIRAAVYEEGYDVPLHVHDEVVLEVPEAQAESAKAWLGDYMSQPPPWAPDLPLSCTPSIMTRYGKD
jgi:DNA polymerase